MSNKIIDIDNLEFCYPDGTSAINGVSFSVAAGESVAIIGANGAGKSSLLLHLNGALRATRGALHVNGLSVNKKNVQQIRQMVGLVFQDPDDQLFMPTVFDDIAFGPLNLNLAPAEVDLRVSQALTDVDLPHLKDRMTHHLSGGEKRRIAIATVLAMKPDILVMDEPTANLDPKGRRSLISLLKGFTHTKIIATHDLDMALALCDRVMIMHNGLIAMDDQAENILTDRQLLEQHDLALPLSLQNCPICSN